MELSKIIMFFLCFIRCFVFLIIILVICMCWFVGLLKVEVIILFWIRWCIFVIFLGCLLISNIINLYLGWLVVIDWVMFCRRRVLFVLGGVMIRLCWLWLIGEVKFNMWVVIFLVELLLCFICKWFVVWSGVRFLKRILLCEFFGLLKFILWIFSNVKYCLLFFGGCIFLVMVLFVCRLKCLIWFGDM